jgi:hypothetical protein
MMRVFSANTFWRLLKSPLSFIPHENDVRDLLEPTPGPFGGDSDLFGIFVKLMALEKYMNSVWLGIVSSVGSLTVSVSKRARSALLEFLKVTKTRDHSLFIVMIDTLLKLLKENMTVDRLILPLISTFEVLFSSGLLDNIPPPYVVQVSTLSWTLIKKSSDPTKIMAASSLYCSMLRFPACCKKPLANLAILLCHRFPKVRVTTSTCLHVAIMTFGDVLFSDDEEGLKSERCLQLLVDTDWSQSSAPPLKLARNEICTLVGINPPVALNTN